MTSGLRHAGPRGVRRGRTFCPQLAEFEARVVLSYLFPGIAGIAFDPSGDVYVSYNSTSPGLTQQQSVAEVGANGYLISPSVFSTTGSNASPGALSQVNSSTLPTIGGTGDLLELQPNGQLYAFDPASGTSSLYDNLAADSVGMANVYDVQTGSMANLAGKLNLQGATYGDFGVYQNSLVVSAESNGWDFVMRVTYASAAPGTATILAASPASDGLSASPGGVAVDSQGTVLATMPYTPSGTSTAIHVPVGFNISYDAGASPSPFVANLGLSSVPNIQSGGIAVDSQDNFILAVKDSSLYGGGQGIVHINASLTAFLADPTPNAGAVPSAISYQNVSGTNYLAFTDTASDTYTVAGELPLFSGQVTPAQLIGAYGINKIQFPGPAGGTVAGTGAGQTIAIVEEGVDPTLAADLKTFDRYFGIPDPPSFQVVDQNGVATQNLSIVGEASLDVEWAHAIAPGASIVVYNAAYDPNNGTASVQNLLLAMQQASKLPGVSVVTLSYGITESSLAAAGLSQTAIDSYFTTPGVTFLAAAGDSGIYSSGTYTVAANYPAASPNVVSVGGTSIVIDAAGNYPGTGTSGELAWGSGVQSGVSGGGGGGLSSVESQPSWQAGVVPSSMNPNGARALPDVSMDSGSAQQYDVFASTLSGSSVSASAVGWLGDAGTSAASPIWAGLIAIADQGRAQLGGTPLTGYSQTLPALYSLPSSDYHDIIYGSNGYSATTGYDLATGLGTPVANLLVPDLAAYGLGTRMSIASQPPSSIAAGSPFGLTVDVLDSQGQPASSGTVTVALGTAPSGTVLGGTLTASVVNGVATFSGLTLNQAGTCTLTVSDVAISGSLTTSQIDVSSSVTATGTSSVALAGLPSSPTFGQPITLTATVSSSSSGTGVPTGSVTFADGSGVLGTVTLVNGVAQLTISLASVGSDTFTASYSGNDPAASASQTVTIGQAAPSIVWSAPANITVGTPLGSGQLDATANFDGTPLAGVMIYWPPAGTVLSVGNGRTLSVTFVPGNTTDFLTVSASVSIDVVPASSGGSPTPTPSPSPTPAPGPSPSSSSSTSTPSPGPSSSPGVATILGEQPVFRRKPNRRGKPVGPPILAGYRLQFSTSLGAAAADPANYQVSSVFTRRLRKTVEHVLHPIAGFSVTYSSATDSATIGLPAGAKLKKGGQIAVLSGVTGGTGESLAGTSVFAIAPGGKRITPS